MLKKDTKILDQIQRRKWKDPTPIILEVVEVLLTKKRKREGPQYYQPMALI